MKIFELQLDQYGLMIDSEWGYLSLSWVLMGFVATALIVWRIYKRSKNVF